MTKMTRRQFIGQTALAAGALNATSLIDEGAAAGRVAPMMVSTWRHGKLANEAALEVLRTGGSPLDAVEQGIWVTEADARESSVGIGGIPNADGAVQLDACIMEGPGHGAGSVAALEDILHPISVARRVMEQTPHVMLVGDGARKFALEQGFEQVELLTEERRRAWLAWSEQNAREKAENPRFSHDTVALLVLGANGDLAGGCSTSGWGYKLPGRVGDSPIIGSGLYVDNEVGAAGATGTGENVMRYCGSFMVVEYMRQGLHPRDACIETIRRIASKDPLGFNLDIHFIALDKRGRQGAAGCSTRFDYSVTTETSSEVLQGAGTELLQRTVP